MLPTYLVLTLIVLSNASGVSSAVANETRYETLRREGEAAVAKGDLEGALRAYEAADQETLFEVPNYANLINIAEIKCLQGDVKRGLEIVAEFKCMLSVVSAQLPCYVNKQEPSDLGTPNPELLPECFKRLCHVLYLPYWEDEPWRKRQVVEDLRNKSEQVEQLCGAGR